MLETGSTSPELMTKTPTLEEIRRELRRYNNLQISILKGKDVALLQTEKMVESFDEEDDETSESDKIEWRAKVDELKPISDDIIRVGNEFFSQDDLNDINTYLKKYNFADPANLSEEDEKWLRKYWDKMNQVYEKLLAEPYNYSDSQLGVVIKPEDNVEQEDNSGENE